MSEEIPTLNLHRGKSWSEWTKFVGSFPDILSEKVKRRAHPSVYLLPRKDILLYGCCPKMDVRVLCQCSTCGKVTMPSGFTSHCKDKHGPEQSQTPAPLVAPGTSLLKKKHPHTKTNKKKPVLPAPVPPPPLFPRQATPPPSPISAPAADLSPPVLLPVQITKPATPPSGAPLSSSTNNIPKHKKSKKGYKKIKEYDPDKHCGVIEGHKGPCLRSITCSNHMVLLRKAVPGRSKDFQQLIADHKAAKDKEASKLGQMLVSKIETTTSTSQNATFRNVASTYVKIAPTLPTPTTALTTKSEVHVISQPLHVTVTSPAMANSNSQGYPENCSSVVYMPMSPVGVVSPLQFVQLEGTILRVASTQPLLSPPLGTQPVVVTIPVQNNNTPMYTSHPKPLIMSTCSTRKIGSTFVLQNERIDRQRSEIQIAANTRRSIANSCSILNSHHKPNILKNSTRAASLKINAIRRHTADKLINDARSNTMKNSTKGSNIKVSAIKRQAADSIVNDTKQIRLNDVNGFILHADVSEGAEAPQSNNSIHDKITFINMK